MLRRHCLSLHRTWWATHYAVGLVGVLSGVLAANPPQMISNASWVLGTLAAVCTSLVTFLGPLHKAEKYWKAYHIMDQTCLEYEQGQKTLKQLLADAKLVRRLIIGGAVDKPPLHDDAQDPGRR